MDQMFVFMIFVFIGYFIKGTIGFAGGLFSLAFLAMYYDMKFIIPIISLLELFAGLMLFPSIKKHIDKTEFLHIIIGTSVGTLIGTFFLKRFATSTLKTIFGIVVILFSLNMLLDKYYFKLKIYFGTIFGMVGGITGGMFSTNGPPIALYLGHKIKNKKILRGTLVSVFLVDEIWRNGVYFFTKTFTKTMMKTVVFMVPVLAIAMFVGSKVHLRISEEGYRMIVAGALIMSGILLLI
ncbi:MAG: hypothetical protein MAG795_00771 [Candidatus Woesearchaeota archaeon]|nr:hypothetical protein [Candidatus Woesearchaeota archaeon]